MNQFPSREIVEDLRRKYPVGCRVVLDEMNDPYTKIPIGSQGECRGIDDAGSIMVAWDCGSSLSCAWPVDRCHKIRTEEEARVTLEWYGKHQPEKDARCPRCGELMFGPTARNALSRRINTYICNLDGMKEALEDVGIMKKLPLTEWCAVRIPSIGGGKWRR